jgi:TRAP-type mannitol/chloroaromatic compound transport system permease large subunit
MLIVYSAIADLSPLRLYAAAVFPGLLLAGLYIVYVIVRVWITPSLAPRSRRWMTSRHRARSTGTCSSASCR